MFKEDVFNENVFNEDVFNDEGDRDEKVELLAPSGMSVGSAEPSVFSNLSFILMAVRIVVLGVLFGVIFFLFKDGVLGTSTSLEPCSFRSSFTSAVVSSVVVLLVCDC